MLSLTPDQFKFLVANLAGVTLAVPYKYVPKSMRHEFNYLTGIVMLYYCFGRQANTLMVFSAVSYLIYRYTPLKHVHQLTMFSSLAFLSYTHLNRQILDYGGYVLDISGPFMIAVQKLTSLGLCLHDYFRLNKDSEQEEQLLDSKTSIDTQLELNNNNTTGNDSFENTDCLKQLTETIKDTQAPDTKQTKTVTNIRDSSRVIEERRKYAVKAVPSFNEFLGYFFHFGSVLCGPIVYYKDYSDFVETPKETPTPPGRFWAVAKKLAISGSCAILHLTLNARFDVEFLRSPGFLLQTPFLIRFYYIYTFSVLSRLKYYVAWHLGEAISNASGLGFSGYDSQGKPKWDLLSNMDLWKFETCCSMRDSILAWNKTTQTWLRRTAYDRVPRKFAVLATYILSAIWHGFYPGYYLTFLSGALITIASRSGRRLIGPLFQKGRLLPIIYTIITFILTRLTIAYVAFPFVILDFHDSIHIYKSLLFSIHALGVAGIALDLVTSGK